MANIASLIASVLFALMSALLFGAGTAAQHRVSARLRRNVTMPRTLIVRLTRDPLWMAGIGLEIAAFGCQLVALRRGKLVIVQPILSLSLVIALLITAAAIKAKLCANDKYALSAVVAGLAVFLAVTMPRAEHVSHTTTARWVTMSLLGACAVVGAVSVGHRSEGRRRAQGFACAAGVADAMMAALAKALSEQTDHGFITVLTSWPLYSVATVGVVALLVQQAAYQTARPAITLPIISVVEPVLSVIVGVTVFGEHIARGVGRGFLAAGSLGVLVAGLAILARSPLADEVQVREMHVR
jgi:drug/metabolite transporter (DMT)-like permease